MLTSAPAPMKRTAKATSPTRRARALVCARTAAAITTAPNTSQAIFSMTPPHTGRKAGRDGGAHPQRPAQLGHPFTRWTPRHHRGSGSPGAAGATALRRRDLRVVVLLRVASVPTAVADGPHGLASRAPPSCRLRGAPPRAAMTALAAATGACVARACVLLWRWPVTAARQRA